MVRPDVSRTIASYPGAPHWRLSLEASPLASLGVIVQSIPDKVFPKAPAACYLRVHMAIPGSNHSRVRSLCP